MSGEHNRARDRLPRRISIVAPAIPGAVAWEKGISSPIRVAGMPGTIDLHQAAHNSPEVEQTVIDYPEAFVTAGRDPSQGILREHADTAGWIGIHDRDSVVDRNTHRQLRNLTGSCGVPY